MDELTITIDGRSHSCHFKVADGVVTVYSAYGTKATQQGGLTALQVAELLLRELVHASKDK